MRHGPRSARPPSLLTMVPMRLPRASEHLCRIRTRTSTSAVAAPTQGGRWITAQHDRGRPFPSGIAEECRRPLSVAVRSTPKRATRRPKSSFICPSPAPHSRQVDLILGRQNFGTQAPLIKVTMRCCIRASAASRYPSLIPNSRVRASIGDANVVISGYNVTSSVIGSISRGTRVRIRRSPAVDRARARERQ